jgi:hypothetical protein
MAYGRGTEGIERREPDNLGMADTRNGPCAACVRRGVILTLPL